MFSKKIQKYITLLLLCCEVLFFTTSDGYGRIMRHSLDDLPYGNISWTSEKVDITDDPLLVESVPDIPSEELILPFQNTNIGILSNALIEKRVTLHGIVQSTIITSELLEDTLIRNAQELALRMEDFWISETHGKETEQVRAYFQMKEWWTQAEIITFEYGIPGEHLIFSKPVRLEVNTPSIPDWEQVDLLVRHANDNQYNISGLSIYQDTKCMPDGTSTKPSSKGVVKAGKVVFYTCGASSFALGYTPIIDMPNNIVWTTTSWTGRLFLWWQFTTMGWVVRTRFAAVTLSGFLDTSFADPLVNNIVYASAIQSDGKVLIGGAFTGVTGIGRNYVARLNSDGTLDAAFNANITLVAANAVRTIVVQSDGKILIGGIFTTVWWVARNRIARLNSDGTLDLTFNANSNNIVYTIGVQSDGKVVLWGTFTTMGWVARNRLARVSSTGALDGAFNPNINNTVWDLKIDGGGNIVFWGQFTTVGVTARNRLARVSSTWGLDGGFNPNVNNTIQAISIEPTGNIIFWGAFTTVGVTARNRIARVSSTGGLDGSFNPNAGNTVYTFTQRNDWSFAVGGAFLTIFGVGNTYLSYINPVNNILDSRFNLVINSTVWTLSPYTADNKVIIGWQFTTVGGVAMSGVARINTGWALDTTFVNPLVNNIVYTSAIQSDGKVLIGGAFTGVTGIGRNYVARLNSDGTLDAAFNANITLVAANAVRTIVVQSDGKILIGGIFTTVWWVARNRIARLNSDGTLDLTFNANSNNIVYTIGVQSDGKVVLWGTFTTMGWVARNRLARVSSTGALDGAFNPNINNTVWDLKIDGGGNIVFWGQFTTVGVTARNRLARVSSTWGLDGGFNPNVNNTIQAISIEPTGNIIFWGAFTTVGVTARNRIARVSSTGGLDGSFNPNDNGTVYALWRDIEYNLLVWWTFTTLGTKTIPYFSWIGLLIPDSIPPIITSVSLSSGSLLPFGDFSFVSTYSDAGAGIDTASIDIALQNWSGATWWDDIAPLYLSGSPDITSSTGTWIFSAIPYGKYRYTLTVRDYQGNSSIVSNEFYIDEIEWTMSQPIIDIGNLLAWILKTSSPNELTITVKTVGVPFTLTMSGTSLIYNIENISHWTGTWWYGYEQYSGGYSDALTSLGGWVTIGSQARSINTDGDKNIYIYRIQYGGLIDVNTPAWDYQSLLSFSLDLNY